MARKAGSKGSETAKRVREAALSLFARQGYAAVSMRQIAEAVGVQPGALYNHFPTKQDLLKDLMLGHMTALLEAWDAEEGATAANSDPAAALHAFTRFHIRYHLTRTDEVFVSYMELRNLEPENFGQVEAARRRYETILTGILEKGAATALFHVPEPEVATRAIIAMLTGLGTWYRPGGRLGAEDIETLYTDMVLKAVSPGQSGSERSLETGSN